MISPGTETQCDAITPSRTPTPIRAAVSETSQLVSIGPPSRAGLWPIRVNAAIATATSTRTDGGINGYSDVHRLHPHARAADRLTAGPERLSPLIAKPGPDSRRNSVSERRGIAPCHPDPNCRAVRPHSRLHPPPCRHARSRWPIADFHPPSARRWAGGRSRAGGQPPVAASPPGTPCGRPGWTARPPRRARRANPI